MTADTQTLLDQAAAHLDAAADLADGGDDPRDGVMAQLIRLTRALIAPPGLDDHDLVPGPDTLTGRIRAALAALDRVDPLDVGPDGLAWSWHVAELLTIVDADGTQP